MNQNFLNVMDIFNIGIVLLLQFVPAFFKPSTSLHPQLVSVYAASMPPFQMSYLGIQATEEGSQK